jgi:cell volume regulation protein A
MARATRPTRLVTLARSFGVGLVVGLISGTIWLFVLKFLHSNEHAYPVTLAALLVLYVIVERLRGSAAFGILTFAVVLGNAKTFSEKLGLPSPIELDGTVRGFHRQMAFIIKSFFFVFIGAMLGPPWTLIVFGVVLGLVLFAARLPSVELALAASGLTKDEKKLVWSSMPRGMAAGVLATLPLAAGVPASEPLPVLVFACVFTTILIFAVGFPLARRRVKAATLEPSAVPLPAGATRPEPGGADVVQEVIPGGGAAPVADGKD